MANRRTVDPTAAEASTRIIGIRVTDTQLAQIAELCTAKNMKRSQLIRTLVREAVETKQTNNHLSTEVERLSKELARGL